VTGCTVEAEYVLSQRKQIVPLRLEADYEPDGWLRMLTGSDSYYDFSDPENFETEWNRLRAKLKEFLLSGC